MAQYIDKSALVAEIDRQISAIDNYPKLTDTLNIQIAVLEGNKVVLTKLLSFLDTLEVKEVGEPSKDLEKEIKEQIDKYYENCNKKLEEIGEDDNDISFLTLDGFARYFYELGLKAKGE